nr:histidine kinase [uncultured Merdimonas sp.]
MKKTHSLLFQILTPIVITTVLLLFLSAATLSGIYQRQAEKTAVSSSLEILEQTDISLSLVHDRIAQIAATIQQTPYLKDAMGTSCNTVQEEWKARQRLSEIFSNSPLAMVDYEITLLGINGIAVSSGNGGVTLQYDDLVNLSGYQKARSSGHIIYGGSQEGFSYDTQDTSVIYGCKTLTTDEDKLFGVILLSIPEASLRQFYQSFSNSSTSILLLSSDGKILSSNIEEEIGSYNKQLLETAQRNQTSHTDYSHMKDGTIILSHYIRPYDAYAISLITPSFLYQEFGLRMQSILTICVTLFILGLLVAVILKSALTPLGALAAHMAESRGVPAPVSLTGSTEIEKITTAYNQMACSINDHVKKLHQAHEQQRKDELRLLQMQINPHFLYNTLDSVKHLVNMNNTADACRIIDSLISLFRSSLGKTSTMVTVADEVKNVQNYIAIVGPRYGGLIQADISAAPDCVNLEIPNLLLQPLIENAFFHAFQKTRTGSIHVFLYQDQEMLFCEITDNGDGMSEETAAQLLSSEGPRHSVTHIGVVNVRERLEILYPGKSSFEITSVPGYGTHITLSFPATIHPSARESAHE